MLGYLRGLGITYDRTIAHPVTGTQVGCFAGETDAQCIIRYNTEILGYTPTASQMPGGTAVAPSPSTIIGPSTAPAYTSPSYTTPPATGPGSVTVSPTGILTPMPSASSSATSQATGFPGAAAPAAASDIMSWLQQNPLLALLLAGAAYMLLSKRS